MWVIKRKKGDIFEIDLYPRTIVLEESYTLLKLSDEEQSKFLKLGEWKQCEDGINTIAHSKSPIYNLFMQLAQQKLQSVKTYNFALKVESDIPGTSRLIRSGDRSKIYIGRRKGVKTFNQTRSNSVCISNTKRNEFFEDIKRLHDYLPFVGSYCITNRDVGFDKWSDFMDNEYLKQTGQV